MVMFLLPQVLAQDQQILPLLQALLLLVLLDLVLLDLVLLDLVLLSFQLLALLLYLYLGRPQHLRLLHLHHHGSPSRLHCLGLSTHHCYLCQP